MNSIVIAPSILSLDYSNVSAQLEILKEVFIYDIISKNEFLYRDLKENKIFFSDDFVCFGKIVNSHISKNLYLFFINNDNQLSLFIKNKGIIWTFEFSFSKYYNELHLDYEETKLEKFIGVYENELWILFSGNRILVLDINTGEELYQFESLNKTLDTSFFINNCFLDETTGVIKILAYLYYIEIDTKTKEAFIKKEFNDISMVNGSYYGGDSIYFVGNNKSKSISNNITGIFNTKTLDIEWSYELEIKDKFHFFVDVPQANDKYFGVKDSENTLYLFERE